MSKMLIKVFLALIFEGRYVCQYILYVGNMYVCIKRIDLLWGLSVQLFSPKLRNTFYCQVYVNRSPSPMVDQLHPVRRKPHLEPKQNICISIPTCHQQKMDWPFNSLIGSIRWNYRQGYIFPQKIISPPPLILKWNFFPQVGTVQIGGK